MTPSRAPCRFLANPGVRSQPTPATSTSVPLAPLLAWQMALRGSHLNNAVKY